MTRAPCPPHDQLIAFGCGKLPAATLDPIAEHVLECARCQRILETTESIDALIARLHPGKALDPFAREPECQRAIATLHSPAAATAPPLPAHLGQYQLVGQLGRGGMGTVYKALHPFLKRAVALKVLPDERAFDPEAVQRFHREMEAIGKLHHPNIVQATDAGVSDGRHFLVMELVEGTDLARFVRQRGPLCVADACAVVRQVAIGLQHAHEHGLVHRDIKPSNLMLSTTGQVKILDLGLSLLRGGVAEVDLTAAGQLMGTLDYLAPEQAFDSHRVDIRADLYSLGCTLYYLLTGQPPYASQDYQPPLQKMLAHASEPIPPLRAQRPEVPEILEAVVRRLLAKKADERFSTPLDVVAALDPFCAGHDLVACQLGNLSGTETVTTVSSTSRQPARGPDGPRISVVADTPRPPAAARRRPASRAWPWVALALLCVTGVLAAVWWSGLLVRVETPSGTLVIAIDQPGVELSIDGQTARVRPPDGSDPIEIKVVPGKHELQVSKGGFETFTRKFSIRAGRQEVVKVHLEPRPAAQTPGAPENPAAERQAVEQVLKWGGTVRLENRRTVKSLAELPAEPLRPLEIQLAHHSKQNGLVPSELTDTDLEALRDLPDSVVALDLRGHEISDRGLDRLTQSPFAARLERLALESPKLTDEGFAHLARCRSLLSLHWMNAPCHGSGLQAIVGLSELRYVDLSNCPVTDAGVAHLASLALQRLELRGSRITDIGLKHLGSIRTLEVLGLNNVQGITGAGLDAIRNLDRLQLLDLAATNITDDALKAIKKLPLSTLYLANTRVSDAGIDTLLEMNTLRQLSVRKSRITTAGLTKLLNALPHCATDLEDAAATSARKSSPATAPPSAIAPFEAKLARELQEAWAQHLHLPVSFTNSIGMQFRLVPPGEYHMGTTKDNGDAMAPLLPEFWRGWVATTVPPHRVILTRPFYLGAHEVTQRQYQQITGSNPAAFSADGDLQRKVAGRDTMNYPVENVSWNDAAAFCNLLCERDAVQRSYVEGGRKFDLRAGNGYRLPTEAEWEFACRAGAATNYCSGDQESDAFAFGWFGANSGGEPHAVGQLKANAFGLFDMHGNVEEWVQDVLFDGKYFQQFGDQPAVDPAGPSFLLSDQHILRGGPYVWRPAAGCAWTRLALPEVTRKELYGFRVALSVEAVRTLLARPEK